jgi:hypothetical protein
MAFAAHLTPGSAAALPHVVAAPRPGPFARLLATVIAIQQARADARVAQFIERNGGRITDEIEREISRRFGGPVT